jgi:hypothetical protein
MGEWRFTSITLHLTRDGGEWSACSPKEGSPGTHRLGGWLGAVVDTVKIKKYYHAGNPIQTVEPVAHLFTD